MEIIAVDCRDENMEHQEKMMSINNGRDFGGSVVPLGVEETFIFSHTAIFFPEV